MATVTYIMMPFPIALKRLEATIEKGSMEAVEAFEDIKQFKLYREDYPGKTFKEYCQIRWKMNPKALECVARLRAVRAKLENSANKTSKEV